tara:strand:+ start:3284 stop:3619 length:336 start_codon:yes stop_codon:yes gene_type:complete
MKRRIGPACLSFLSKSFRALAAEGRLACFFGGRKDNGPTALPGRLACLFYLKKVFPWEELPDSRIGGGEKSACLSFLSKRAARLQTACYGSGNKKPPTFLSGVLGRWLVNT